MITEKEFRLRGENETIQLGAALAKSVGQGTVIYLKGDLGAGKTTLVRGFLHALGHKGAVKSPTYTIVEPYAVSHQHIFHFDLYRLGSGEELDYIGIRDYFTPDSICLVEWPEHGAGYLPSATLTIHLIYDGVGERRAHITSQNERGREILNRLVESRTEK